jgi:glycosyltransferase involved in cell wall biosynthesis
MNPTVLSRATATGRAVVTIQDHRVFCPGMGKTMPDGGACRSAMARSICSACLTDSDYLDRMVRLTTARRDALDGAELVVLSRWMADELTKVGLTGAHVIPPWVEVESAEPTRRVGFLMGGRLVEHKGLMDGLEAWRRADTGRPLVVVGEGPISEGFDGAHCTGWLTSDLLRQRLRSSIALLFPALWQEPFGILGVEALAEGTPVVVADTGGTADWSHAGCVRVQRGAVDEMADAIRWLAEDGQKARRLGREGRSMVATRFARAPIEQKLEALYSLVVAG